MNAESLVIAPSARYRRESLGCAVLCPNKATRFFDRSAAFLLEQFLEPATTDAVIARAVADGCSADVATSCRAFLDDIAKEGLLVAFDPASPNAKAHIADEPREDGSRLHAPLGVELELTLKCRRRCTYCAYESSPRVSIDHELSVDDWKTVLSRLDRLGIFYVRFTGGDPLVRREALEIVEYADSLGFGLSVASDLTALSREHVDRLRKLDGLVLLQTTLDGSTPEIADALRGRGNFTRVMRGLRMLDAAGIPVLVGTVVTRLNVEDVYEIARVISDFAPIAYFVSPLYNAGRGRSLDDLVPTDDDLSRAHELFAQAVADGLVVAGDPAWTHKTAGLSPAERDVLWNGQPHLVRSPDRLLRVDPTGRCYTSIHLKELLGDEAYIGHALDDDLASLWRDSPLLNHMRDSSEDHPYFGPVIDLRTFHQQAEVVGNG